MQSGCAICQDRFDTAVGVVATKCGHIFHNMCIEKWLERSSSGQATCPECRSNVSKKSLTRLFFNFSFDACGNGADESMDVLKELLHTKDLEIMEKDKKIKELQIFTSKAERDLQEKHQLYLELQNDFATLNRKLITLNSVKVKNQKLMQENDILQSELQHLNNVKAIVEGSCEDAKKILEDMQIRISDKEGKIAARRIATYCSVIKRELSCSMEEKNQLQNEISKLKCNIGISAAKKIKFDYLSNKIDRFNSSSSQSSYLRLNPAHKTPVVPDNNSSQCSSLAKHSSVDCHNSCTDCEVKVTPVNFECKHKMNIVVLDKEVPKVSSQKPETPVLKLALPARRNLENEDSVSRIGYNGLGGHEKFFTRNGIKIIKLKAPKKKNI